MSALAALVFVVVSGCKEACLKHVSDARLRATVCGRCFTEGDRAAWAEAIVTQSPSSLPGLLTDDDWAVRWAALRAQARRDAVTEAHALADWVDKEGSLKPCATALHVAGARRETVAALLPPASAGRCWEKRSALKTQVELDLYSTDAATRAEALAHLAAFFEQRPARVVLEAMKSRGPETDALSALALREGPAPAGKALLEVPKTEPDTPLVNRLLAVFSHDIDTLRPTLKSPEVNTRREAIRALAELAPLSAPELTLALEDPDGANRRAAAQALARGEGETVSGLAKKKMTARWLALAGASGEPACAELLETAVADEAVQEDVRAAALPALADCEGARAIEHIAAVMQAQQPLVRAGAADAFGALPRAPKSGSRLAVLLNDKDARVLESAARAAGAVRHKPLLPRLVELLDHPAPAVRREAALALGAMEATQVVPKLARALGEDDDASVRVACAKALGDLGGSGGIGALVSAADSDKDSKVKFVAAESLRRLGFKKSP